MEVKFRLPKFDSEKTTEGNYIELLMALGLLSEDVPGVTREMAERELAKSMPSFTANGQDFAAGPDQYVVLALVYALRQAKSGAADFYLSPEDFGNCLIYFSEETANKMNKEGIGNRFVELLLQSQRRSKSIQIKVNLKEQ